MIITDTIRQQAKELAEAMRRQPCYRDTVSFELVFTYATLWVLFTTSNPYHVVDWFDESYLKVECYNCIVEVVGCTPENLSGYMQFFKKNGIIEYSTLAGLGNELYIQVVCDPELDVDES